MSERRNSGGLQDPWMPLAHHGMSELEVRAAMVSEYRIRGVEVRSAIRAALIEQGCQEARAVWLVSIAFERVVSQALDRVVPAMMDNMARTASKE